MSWSDLGDVVIEPSIYAADFSRLGAQLETLHGAGASVFHFDVGDGAFIPEITIGPVVLASISPYVRGWGATLDCHLMVAEPEKHFEAIAKAGGDSVTFHVEVRPEPAGAIAEARSLGLGVGIAFNPETPVEVAAAAAEGADLALCMSIHPGYSGQPFQERTYERVRELRALLPPAVRIQVDGGVGADNIARLRDEGVSLFVAASSIFAAADPVAAYRGLEQALR
jgi:ribulose-phosphate 3-epimerase